MAASLLALALAAAAAADPAAPRGRRRHEPRRRRPRRGSLRTLCGRGRDLGDGAFRAVFDMELEPPRPGQAATRTVRRSLASQAGDLTAEVGTWTAAGGARGSYLAVRRRGAGGALEAAVETFPAFAR